MAARYPHGAWFLLSGLACLLLLVGPMTGWFVAMWLAPINIVDAGPGADEGLFAGVVLGGGVALLSLASVILILIGLDQMRLTYPVVGSRISRRVGPIILTPTWVVVLFVLIGLFSTLFSPKEAMQAPYFRAASTVARAALLALGTFLMIVSEEGLRPLVSRSEERVVFAAGMAALFGGLLLVGSGLVAFLVGLESGTFLPWASVPAGLSGPFAVVVAALTYRRKGLGKPLTKIGHFTGLVDFGYYALSLCTDSVGTKVLVAKEMRKWDTIGIDCVAMNVNDMICIGAEPLAFVDYVAVSDYDREVARQIGIGLNRGAELANVSIIGGEIAVVPELVRELDLAGTCFGVVRKSKIIDGRAIRTGDVIVGLPSAGIHSNGLTLARRILRDASVTLSDPVSQEGRPWGDELLEPTAIYVKPVLRAIRKATIHGMAHITGGGLRNLVR